jgi:ABC-2 type transport system permease protein
MVARIAAKEFIDTLRDGRYRWSAIIVLTLLAAALGAGYRNWRDVSNQHARASDEMRAFWVNQPAKNPHSAAHYGLWAFKPRTMLSMVDQGVDPYVGVAAYLEAHKQNEFQFRPAMDATATQRFGQWTAATILQVLLPLLIVVLAFPAFAGEKELGTLRQLVSMGIPPAKLAGGKALGVAAALGTLLVPAAILGSVALALGAAEGTMGIEWPRIALMVVAYLAYFGVFVAVSLVVSARAPSSRVALFVLLAFWAANSLVAPRVFTDVARRAAPTPSAFEFITAVDTDLKKGLDGHNPGDRAEALKQQVLAKYGVASVDSLPVNFDAISMQQGEEDANRVFDKHYGALYDAYQRQNTIHQFGAITAPLLAVRSISMGLSGTDVEHHRAFAESAERYRRMLIAKMNGYMAEHSRTGDWDSKAPTTLWAEVEPFAYEAPQISQAMAVHLPAIWLLAGWVLVASGAVTGTRKLRVD